MLKQLRSLVLVCVVPVLAGCSAYMAANQPGPKDLSLLTKGTPRGKLIAEFGSPINTEVKDGARKVFLSSLTAMMLAFAPGAPSFMAPPTF